MTVRLPLFGRILVWLALNLVLLAAVVGIVLLTEFRIEPLLMGLVGERTQRAADVLIAELKDRDPALAAELSVFRDEELAHHDHAVSHGSREAPAYDLLSTVIRAGCRAAIKISERF